MGNDTRVLEEIVNLDNLRVVLVGTTHPGNIGAAARAMKTMGLHRLVLVNPARYPDAEATARAVGADDVLARARVVDDLDAALTGCVLVIGTSARRRGLSGPALDPRQCAARIAELEDHAETALVFGRESSGLSNDELDRCHYRVFIPANPEFGSLNLAAAVQVLAYELRMAWLAAMPVEEAQRPAPSATAEDMERFYAHLQRVLLVIGFLDPANPRHLMRRLRRLFNRAQPSQVEMNILRGILSSVERPKRRGCGKLGQPEGGEAR